MNTSAKMDIDNSRRDELMRHIDEIYKGETLECPKCHSKSAHSEFRFFGSTGYCIVGCDKCDFWTEVLSRVSRTDKIKAKMVEV